MNTCKTCHYWERKFPHRPPEEAYQGYCHRYPPGIGQESYEDGWCGEWKAREEEKP